MAEFTAEQVRATSDRWRQIARDYRVSQDRDGSVSAVPYEQLVAILDAYAERLEQEAGLGIEVHGPAVVEVGGLDGSQVMVRALASSDGEMISMPHAVFTGQLASEREAGRREILREIAGLESSPIAHFGIEDERGLCQFCTAQIRDGEAHDPRCLWLRAQEAAKELG